MESDATYRGTVYPWQCDHVGHMNIMWYVGKFDEANWNLFARIGLTPTYLRQSGHGMAAVQQNIGDKSIRFRHEMRNAETGEIAAACEITGVHLDRRTRKSTPFGAQLRRQIQDHVAVPQSLEA
jgi:acyl-CoA thioester hydrolase